ARQPALASPANPRARFGRKRYLVRAGVDQPPRQLARVFDRGAPFSKMNRAVLQQVAGVSPHSFVDRNRNRADRRMIEVDVVLSDGKEFSNLRVHTEVEPIIATGKVSAQPRS